jgi:putative spermidine/putrescine transport system permease protein
VSRRGRQRLAIAALLAPAVALLLAFFVVPSVDLFRLSLARMDEQRTIHPDVSLGNYRNFATSVYFHRMAWGSVKLTAWVTALCLLLGYPAAYHMVHARSTMYRTILYAVVVSPLLISVIVRTYGWVVLLANNGVVNGTLTAFGLVDQPIRMLGTFGSVVVATVHVLLPFMMLPIASALQDLDPVLERAAQNLGATPAQTFWRVTLPLSMPGVLAGTSLVIALTLGIYITPLLIAGPLQPLFAIGIYYVTLNQLDFPLGAALSFVLLAFTLAVLALVARLLRFVNRGVAA